MPSVSKKQHNFMAAVANNPKFAKKAGVPSSVGKEFLTADKGKTFKEGGPMKPTDMKKNPGMAKLPTAVRNKMGFMKEGGMACSPSAMKKTAKTEVKSHEKKMHGTAVKKMAKGGGCEIKGKTKGTMIKMKKGGAC